MFASFPPEIFLLLKGASQALRGLIRPLRPTLRQTRWEHFQGLQGKARIRGKRPKRASKDLGGTP